jgi:hypothetical protein
MAEIYEFPVDLRKVFDEYGDEIPKSRHVMRTDNRKSLAIVSDRYNLIPHKPIAEVVELFAKSLGGKVSRTVKLESEGGKLVLEHTFKDIDIKLPGHKIPGAKTQRDTATLTAFTINSYNRETSFSFRLGSIIARCSNGMLVMDDYFHIRHKHLKGIEDIQFPKPELAIAAFQSQSEQWEKWAEIPLTQDQVQTMLSDSRKVGLIPLRSAKDFAAHFNEAETAWDAYNAFTRALTHGSPRMGASGRLGRLDQLNRFFIHQLNQPVKQKAA